jgi:hypothetical protein
MTNTIRSPLKNSDIDGFSLHPKAFKWKSGKKKQADNLVLSLSFWIHFFRMLLRRHSTLRWNYIPTIWMKHTITRCLLCKKIKNKIVMYCTIFIRMFSFFKHNRLSLNCMINLDWHYSKRLHLNKRRWNAFKEDNTTLTPVLPPPIGSSLILKYIDNNQVKIHYHYSIRHWLIFFCIGLYC